MFLIHSLLQSLLAAQHFFSVNLANISPHPVATATFKSFGLSTVEVYRVPEMSGKYGLVRILETRPKLRIPAGIVKHSMKYILTILLVFHLVKYSCSIN